MRRTFAILAIWGSLALSQPAQVQLASVRVGFCARTLSSGAAPFAIATRMGWFKDDGIDVNLVRFAGSSDCIKNVSTKEIPFALASPEPSAAARLQHVQLKTFYTAYQGNIFRLAVPVASPIQKVSDLRGTRIGVASMGAGVLFAKALVAMAGMNPETDVRIIVVGEGAQTAAMIRSRQVDALSQFDTQYAMVENAGITLRMLEAKEIERFPGNGFVALEDTLRSRRKDAIALARGYAKGTIFAINNPQAAVRILYDVFPEVKATGRDEAAAVSGELKVLQARIPNWRLERGGVTRWGESSEPHYSAYLDFLLKWGILREKIRAQDLITNELIDEINRFDSNRIVAEAKAYRPR